MLTGKTIGFIGGGNLAEALIKGLIASGTVSAGAILACDKLSDRLIHIARTYEVRVLSSVPETARDSDIIFITVKPPDVAAALREAAPELGKGKLVISAAAGITTRAILSTLADAGLKALPQVVRAMPNTPAIELEAATCLCPAEGADPHGVRLAETLFKAVGLVAVIDDEALMDAVTGLSGSGPAYIFYILEALIEAGVVAGIPEKEAKALALQTAYGAAKLARRSDKDIKELRRMVTSPGGTTFEGIKKLEESGVREAVIGAVLAATKRARELSNPDTGKKS